MSLESYRLDTKAFLALLEKLIKEVPNLQNNPPQLVPKEDEAGKHVLARLKPYEKILKVTPIALKPNRGHILVEYNPTNSTKTVSFVGSHLDVVPVGEVSQWKRDPCVLTVEGNNLYGRGVTDCLGHVALLTEMFVMLAEKKPQLNVNVVGLFIANEEAPLDDGVGVESLMKTGKIDFLKNGPVYWVDSADKQPCIGTAGVQQWKLTAKGRLFHSGIPQKAINSLELAMEAVSLIQKRFYEDFPAHPDESKYSYATSSTMKPTQWESGKGSLNQIPAECSISGDIRLTPFYDMIKVRESIEKYVKDINANITSLPQHGPFSKYVLPSENLQGALELTWLGEGILEGIACNLESIGYKALCGAFQEVCGECKPFSLTGSLPLVRNLQRFGYDVQITGFGKMSAYHAIDEYGELKDFEDALRICCKIVDKVSGSTSGKPAEAKKEAKKEEEEIDLFGSDDEEEDEAREQEIIRKAKEAEEKKKASGKEKPVLKSAVVIDVKPWEDTTDLAHVEATIRAMVFEGLEWKASKLVPIGYGIKKLSISCHVVDDIVSIDEVQEKIQDELPDHVQSTDIQSFTKL